jgi:hypothetical protein
MRWDSLRGRWYDRFLVPQDIPDGEIEIIVFVLDNDGVVTRHIELITVDSQAEEFQAWLEQNQGTTVVHIVAEEPLRSIQIQPVGRPDLRRRINLVLNDALEHEIIIPGLWEEVEMSIRDRAMNTLVQRVQR